MTLGSGSTLDVESPGGATLDGVTVTGTNASTGPTVAASLIEIGTTGSSTLKLDDGTSIKNGNLTIAGGSTLDVESTSVETIDGVKVTGAGTMGPGASTIAIGETTSAGSILKLDDGTSIKSGTLNIAAGSTLDIEKGATGPGATLDGVTVIGTGATSTIDVGTTASGATIALLDDGTSITNATLNIAAGSTLDIEKGTTGPGATLDGVAVIGTDTTSTIDVGTTTPSATVALLDDGTSIKNVTLNIAADSTLDIEKGVTGPGATLDGVTVIGSGTTSTIDVGTMPSGVTLTLDDATSITSSQLVFGGSSDRIFVGSGGATLVDVTVSGGGETDIGSATVTGVTLTLDGTTIIGGTINDGTSTAGGIIHVTANSTIEGVVNGLVTTNASLNGAVNIDANTTLKLDNVAGHGHRLQRHGERDQQHHSDRHWRYAATAGRCVGHRRQPCQ